MFWLMLFLAGVLVLGPVLYLLPSARDKRLSKLRAHARLLGLSVKITQLPKLDPDASERVSAGGKLRQPRTPCASYQLPLTRPLRTSGAVLLLKIPAQATVPVTEVVPGWSLDVSSEQSYWRAYWQAGQAPGVAADGATIESQPVLQQCLQQLPEDALGFAISPRYVECYWLEKAPAQAPVVEQIKSALELVAADIYRRFGEKS